MGRGAEARPERPLDRFRSLQHGECDRAAGPAPAQAITNLGPIYWNDPSWLFGILGDLHYASPSSLTTGSSACEQDVWSCFIAVVVCPRTASKAFSVFGLGFGLSEGGSLPSGVGGVSSKAAASIFVPSIAVPSRPPRSFWISQIYRSSVPLSLSLSLFRIRNIAGT